MPACHQAGEGRESGYYSLFISPQRLIVNPSTWLKPSPLTSFRVRRGLAPQYPLFSHAKGQLNLIEILDQRNGVLSRSPGQLLKL